MKWRQWYPNDLESHFMVHFIPHPFQFTSAVAFHAVYHSEMCEIALLQNTERIKWRRNPKFATRIFVGNYLTRIPIGHMHSSLTLSVMATKALLLTWLFEKNIISSPMYVTRNFRKPILPSHEDSDHSTVKC